jgi:uncharacterized protein (TIGR03435 family)
MTRTYAIAGLAALLAGIVCGQTTTGTPAFEVASVKVSPPGQGRETENCDEVRCSLHNYPMVGFIMIAYNVNVDRVSGPDWMMDTRYDFDATYPAGTNLDTIRIMMQNLLAERFKLVVHHDQTPAPVYALVVVKKGPKLLKASDSTERDDCHRLQGAQLTCRLHKTTMTRFAESIPHWLSQHWLELPVIDQTGIQGEYDVTLTWTMTNRRDDTVEPPALSLFDAIEDQLGLKLEQRKAPFDRIVVDHAERIPVAN